jgi:hypothetical protein
MGGAAAAVVPPGDVADGDGVAVPPVAPEADAAGVWGTETIGACRDGGGTTRRGDPTRYRRRCTAARVRQSLQGVQINGDLRDGGNAPGQQEHIQEWPKTNAQHVARS